MPPITSRSAAYQRQGQNKNESTTSKPANGMTILMYLCFCFCSSFPLLLLLSMSRTPLFFLLAFFAVGCAVTVSVSAVDCGIGNIDLSSLASTDLTYKDPSQRLWLVRPCGPTNDFTCRKAGALTSACMVEESISEATAFGFWKTELWHNWSFLVGTRTHTHSDACSVDGSHVYGFLQLCSASCPPLAVADRHLLHSPVSLPPTALTIVATLFVAHHSLPFRTRTTHLRACRSTWSAHTHTAQPLAAARAAQPCTCAHHRLFRSPRFLSFVLSIVCCRRVPLFRAAVPLVPITVGSSSHARKPAATSP